MVAPAPVVVDDTPGLGWSALRFDPVGPGETAGAPAPGAPVPVPADPVVSGGDPTPGRRAVVGGDDVTSVGHVDCHIEDAAPPVKFRGGGMTWLPTGTVT